MSIKQHSRQYDLVVFGATGLLNIYVHRWRQQRSTDQLAGYTGKYTAEHITTSLPTNLKWALAGRSREKLEKLAAQLKPLNPDRQQPGNLLSSAVHVRQIIIGLETNHHPYSH